MPYFRGGRVEVELALARETEQRHRRRDIAKCEAQREMKRALRSGR